MKSLEQYVTTIPDFPAPGIQFRDITSVLADKDGLKLAVDKLLECLQGVRFDGIAALESRGFLFGMPLAYLTGKPFIPVRKKGKLPRETAEQAYTLEYGTAVIEVHRQDVKPGMRLVLIDDLLATGGTLKAAAQLLERLGAEVVKLVTLIELYDLGGRTLLEGYDVASVIGYAGE